jgi:RHS repeat-associated protein
MTVALRTIIDSNSTLVYFLTDPLGSVVAVTDANGALVSEQRYLPFGEVRTDVGTISQTDFGYTGQRNLDGQGATFDLGLMDYKARFYDPYITHEFIQPDSIIPDQNNPQSLDRYTYVLNNPIRYNDPSGHCISGAVADTVLCIWVGMMVAGAVIDAGINIHNQLQDTGHVDINQVIDHAVEGAVIGGAPLMAAFVAPAIVATAGETLASTGQALESNSLTKLDFIQF